MWLIGQFTSPNSPAFRATVITILAIADLALAWFITSHVSRGLGWLFLLNPLSMVISGFHLQFDNVALAMGAGAVGLALRSRDPKRFGQTFVSQMSLAVSLCTKHVLLLHPVWSVFRRMPMKLRIYALSPVVMFAASFGPWLTTADGRSGVLRHVVLYQGGRELPILGIVGEWIEEQRPLIGFVVGAGCVLALLAVGWMVRDRDTVTVFFVYLLAAFGLSPGSSNQQLVVLLLALIGLRSRAAIPVMLYGWLFLTVHPDGLNVMSDPFSWFTTHFPTRLYDVMIALEYSPFIVVALVVLVGQLRRAPATRGA
jgi:hypothetical protein